MQCVTEIEQKTFCQWTYNPDSGHAETKSADNTIGRVHVRHTDSESHQRTYTDTKLTYNN